MNRTECVTRDMKRSSVVIKAAEPLISDLLCCNRIVTVEGEDNDACILLDRTCGIDYLRVIDSTGEVKGIASRVQWVNPAYRTWDTFTIRDKRESGITTEFEKRKNQIKAGGFYPDFTIQIYANSETNEIMSLGIARTVDIIDYIERCNPPQRVSNDGNGNAWFYYFKWIDMLKEGYDVTIYRKGA